MNNALLQRIDARIIQWLQRYGVTVLRLALGVVFLWFGLLKVLGMSPVGYVVQSAYALLPIEQFLVILGLFEVVVGFGLLTKRALRIVFALLWIEMLGTFLALISAPALFMRGTLFALTVEGEFVMKNLVLVAASMVVAGATIRPWQQDVHDARR
ncbi:MAG: DoxX family protein [Candidatus Paceibacterota bacterium]|nr:MAG: DoxX family protein [Candidatus Paceibacterota bacterium]